MTTEHLNAALKFAEKGIPVFPCRQTKAPATPHGFKDASKSTDQIRKWWHRHQKAPIGLPTGRASGFVVLDIDCKNGIDGKATLLALEEKCGKLPETIVVLTPSGMHIYFKAPDCETVCSTNKLGAGLDFRGDGGYVIAPPSTINGKRYEWEASNSNKFAELPDWLLEKVRKKEAPLIAPTPTTVDPIRCNEALSVLRYTADEGRDKWLQILMSFKAAGGELDEFAAWSEQQDGWAGMEALTKEWESVSPNGGITAGTLFYLAKQQSRERTDLTSDSSGLSSAADFGDRTEDALAQTLVKKHPDVRYVHAWGRWFTWTGIHWKHDNMLTQYDRARAICREAAKGTNKESYATALKKAATINAVVSLAKSDRQYAATLEQWDTDPWLLNTPGGIVDLRTGDLGRHDPKRHMTKVTRATPGGECPLWLGFLSTVMAGNQEIIGYLQRYFGYCLTGTIGEHVFQFLFGTGRNGKGVYTNTLRGAMGDYAQTLSMDTLTESYGERHPTELAQLVGSRLATAEEVEEGRRWAENRIKQLTGGSPISARFMRQDFFEFAPQFKLMIAGNHKPALRDVDRAIRDRLQIVPFRVYIEPEKRDKDLEDKLRAEWSGILQWGIQGCLEWQDKGLAPPESVREETENYFTTQDVFGQWLEDECITDDPQAWEPPSRLFAGWREYAKDNNVKTGTQAEFTDRLSNRGYRRNDDRQARRWSGIKLRNDPGSQRA